VADGDAVGDCRWEKRSFNCGFRNIAGKESGIGPWTPSAPLAGAPVDAILGGRLTVDSSELSEIKVG
jgi:hypothetical protein